MYLPNDIEFPTSNSHKGYVFMKSIGKAKRTCNIHVYPMRYNTWKYLERSYFFERLYI